MHSDVLVQLHDRASRGGNLSADERARLQQWYAEQDQAESDMLRRAPVPQTARLREEVNETIAQLVAVSQQLQTQSTENDRLRREIDVLERRLAQRTAVPPR